MDERDVSYIAGLFDGEGTARYRLRKRDKSGKSRGRRYKHHQRELVLVVSIANKNRDCLEFCKARFGGTVRRTTRPAKSNSCPLYLWAIEGGRARRFVDAMMPCVIVKRPHVEVILNKPKAEAFGLLRIFNQRGRAAKGQLPLDESGGLASSESAGVTSAR